VKWVQIIAAATFAFAPVTYGADFTVLAAASLKEPVDAHAKAMQSRGAQARIAYAGSPALVRQLEAGAPTDVLITADAEWMDVAQQKGLIASASRRVIASNRLVLVAPSSNNTSPVTLATGLKPLMAGLLGGTARLAIADPNAVPAGRYAQAALTHAGAWDTVKAKLAPMDNVRGALALVARAEAPLGIVYASDAQAEPKVRVIHVFAPESHPRIVYAAALTPRASAAASAWLDALERDAALWTRHGFLPPGANAPR
jgi:molybdate transport system substrate-binding protein